MQLHTAIFPCTTFIWNGHKSLYIFYKHISDFEILVRPRITKAPANTKVIEGENVTLTCDAEGPPKPSFEWDFVMENVTIEKIVENNNILELQNVRSTGLYNFTVTCKASNKGGSHSANATITIVGKFSKNNIKKTCC